MPRPTHPSYPTLASDRVPDPDPVQEAAARRVVLARYASGRLSRDETRELLLMLGLAERGVA